MRSWPNVPGRKSPFARNGRSFLRCGEIIGSPPLPGTSVKCVDTIQPPALRIAAATGFRRAGSSAIAADVWPARP